LCVPAYNKVSACNKQLRGIIWEIKNPDVLCQGS
jgi:hypothetical protein